MNVLLYLDSEHYSMVEQQTVQATATSFAIVEALLDEGCVGVTSLANQLDLPKSTVHKHLSTLVELGYVEKSEGEYVPAFKLAGLGARASQTRPLYEVSKSPINRLAESTEEHTGVYVAMGTTGFDLYSTSGQRALLDDIDPVPSRHLHCNASGKAILAQWSDEQLASIIESGLPELTDNTISSESELRNEIARVRERGVAFDRSEQSESLCSVAVSLNVEEVDAAVYVAAPQNRMRGKRLKENLPGLLSNTARKIRTGR
jgi:DNA-binding IclR family transcriptional regulator